METDIFETGAKRETMTTPRMKELLLKAAKSFEQLSNPFDAEWLGKNEVTLDECGDLSETIAMAIKLYANMPKDDRMAAVIKQTVNESELPEEIKALTNAKIDMDLTIKRLERK